MKTLTIVRLFSACFLSILAIFLIYLMWCLNNKETTRESTEGMERLIDTLNYRSEWDSTQNYRITPLIAQAKVKPAAEDVTLVTQTSLHNLEKIKLLVEKWKGHLSVSIFSEAADVVSTLSAILILRKCDPSIVNFVTFHVVTFQGVGNVKYHSVYDNITCSFLPKTFRKSTNYNLRSPYPVNLMRNVARRGVSTPYFFVIDIDMVPSEGIRHGFSNLLASGVIDNNTVYIVPAFELVENVRIPENKMELLPLVKTKLTRPFYEELCAKCHACVHYSRWLDLPFHGSGVSLAYGTQWTDPCEPFYIGHVSLPYYDESFVQYGFNRISQVCELYVAGFSMAVLDNAFLIHVGFKSKDGFHASKDIEQEKNRIRFRQFKKDLSYKYPNSRRHC